MKCSLAVALSVLILGTSLAAQDSKSFRDRQSQFPRVRIASQEKNDILRKRFAKARLPYPPKAILFRAFKKEGLVELWASAFDGGPYSLVHTYSICMTSGSLGPKRRYGDGQVPEGFYELDQFNPASNFFLSLHISYPNASDRILGSHQNPGGNIYFHGDCASIGCIPITDDGIKEVYWVCVLACSSGQRHIPLCIFPARLTDSGFRELANRYRSRPDLVAFWANIKEGFDYFERNHRPPAISVRRDGRYVFSGGTPQRN
jgi:murein L,D-transpeptidase YafK